MNRRIPNGTYGGVGGRELIAPSYPIVGSEGEGFYNWILGSENDALARGKDRARGA